MTDSPGGLPPAGWYPDPYGAPYERWWDGAQWTEHTTPPPAAEPVQPVYEAPPEPAQQSEPVQQAEPYQHAEPVQQAEPYQHAEPVQQSQPYQQAEPVQQSQPYQAAQTGDQEPDYPEYESTFEATQQQPSPSWGAPVSAGPAAAAKPEPSFDSLFGTSTGARSAEPAADFFGGAAASSQSPAVEQPYQAPAAYEAPAYQAPAYQAPANQTPTYQTPASQAPAANDAAFDFGAIIAGGAPASQPGAATGDNDAFSSWSNEDYIEPARNSAATASVAFGVLSFVVPGVAGLLGLIFGAVGLRRASQFVADGDGPVGRTKSIVGIALSVIGTIVSIALVLFVLPGIINPTATAGGTGGTDEASSIVAATATSPNGGILLADGEQATITFPDTTDPSIQFSATGITVDPTCTEDPELVLSPNNGQFISVTMTFTTSADYASQMSTGGLLLVSPTDFVGYLPDGTSVVGSDAGLSCIPEAEQLPDGIPAGATTTATMILDMSAAAISVTYSPVGVTGLETTQTFWEWAIPR